MKKVHGFIVPPWEVSGFLPTVYQEEGNYFIAEIKNGLITLFEKLEEDIPIRHHPINLFKTLNDSAYYFYFTPSYEMINGEFEDLFEGFVSLLYNADINDFAKLTLANFLKLNGLEKKLVKKIEQDLAKKSMGFIANSIIYEELAFKDKLLIKNVFEYWNEKIQKYDSTMSYADIFLIKQDKIYINQYSVELSILFLVVPESINILKNFFSSNNLENAYSILETNKLLFYKIWDTKLIIEPRAANISYLEQIQGIQNMNYEISILAKTLIKTASFDDLRFCEELKRNKLIYTKRKETEVHGN